MTRYTVHHDVAIIAARKIRKHAKKEPSKLEATLDLANEVLTRTYGVYERVCKQARADYRAAIAQANATLTQARASRETAIAQANATKEADIAPVREAYAAARDERNMAYDRAFTRIPVDEDAAKARAEKAYEYGGAE